MEKVHCSPNFFGPASTEMSYAVNRRKGTVNLCALKSEQEMRRPSDQLYDAPSSMGAWKRSKFVKRSVAPSEGSARGSSAGCSAVSEPRPGEKALLLWA
jgi:hypothetical protein